jgi:hypothetical protein
MADISEFITTEILQPSKGKIYATFKKQDYTFSSPSCNIFLNSRSPTEDILVARRVYEELEYVLNHFPIVGRFHAFHRPRRPLGRVEV